MTRYVIGYVSKPSVESDKKLSATFLELLGLDVALSSFREIIFNGSQITVWTDNVSLKGFIEGSKKVPSVKVHRAIERICNYLLIIKHISGSRNEFADCLSNFRKYCLIICNDLTIF